MSFLLSLNKSTEKKSISSLVIIIIIVAVIVVASLGRQHSSLPLFYTCQLTSVLPEEDSHFTSRSS